MKTIHLRNFLFPVLLLMILVTACKEEIDLAAEQQKLLATDEYYSDLAESKGRNAAFIEMFDKTGVILKNDHMPYEGMDSIKALLLCEMDTSYIMSWQPMKAVVSKAGDMGYTYGTYLLRMKRNGIRFEEGTYATIWINTGKKGWKAILDTGNEGLAEPVVVGE